MRPTGGRKEEGAKREGREDTNTETIKAYTYAYTLMKNLSYSHWH
jgi:hypothetical protein